MYVGVINLASSFILTACASKEVSREDNLLWALEKRFCSPEQKPWMLWCLVETSGTTVAM